MKITELEDRISDCDRDMDYHRSEVKGIQSEKTELLKLLGVERGKIINAKKGNIFEFNLGIIKLVINKDLYIRSNSDSPIKIKIAEDNNNFVDCQVNKGTLSDSRLRKYSESYTFCISKQKLYTLLNDHSTYREVINRHKVIEEVLT